ncbi:MAG: phosphoribosylamine--glycine ligase [Bacteroidales bacterium]|jgi:phosphoribosylamine--glycine ligase|nr:phosphoribosylamine--glycine ligase [Bacteroidales bacterium]
MNVLLLGSGGREHAIAWKLAQSSLLTQLFIAPGNAGTAQVGTNIAIAATDFEAVKQTILTENITLVIVGPEDPLVKGVHDFILADDELQMLGVKVLGPQKYAATLEGSKEFAKQFMLRNGVPTAAHFTATAENLEESFAFLATQQPPYVLKADGLAAGKGVLIIPDLATAKTELQSMLQGKFGDASRKVVIEECLHGIEMSVFVLTDGKDYVILPEAKDYKRIGEGDTGLNTGGMGAVSPVPFADEALKQRIEQEIVKPTIAGLRNEKIPYCGFVFIGLMVNNGVPKVIEYNVRMGDPETEVVIPRIESDLLQLCWAAATGNLAGQTIAISPQTATTVMLVSGGYPEAYENGKTIHINGTTAPSMVFHAGTKQIGDEICTAGGRVMAITSLAGTKNDALALSYKAIQHIEFDAMYYRRDIGFDL